LGVIYKFLCQQPLKSTDGFRFMGSRKAADLFAVLVRRLASLWRLRRNTRQFNTIALRVFGWLGAKLDISPAMKGWTARYGPRAPVGPQLAATMPVVHSAYPIASPVLGFRLI